jgi:DNA-binding MarR family transcriptional regulator
MAKPKATPQVQEASFLAEGFPVSYAIFALARVHRALAGTFISGYGLYTGQEILLAHLGTEDGQSQKSLAHLVRSDHSTVSKMVGRLEAAGLVEQRKDEKDERVSRVFLTDAGQRIQESIKAAWGQLEEKTTSGLTNEEAETFVRLAHKMADRLE